MHTMTPRPFIGSTASAAELVDVLTGDHSSSQVRARIRWLLQHKTAPGSTEARLLEGLMARGPRPPARIPPHASPFAGAVVPEDRVASRDMTPAEGAWLQTLPTDPAALSTSDATTLATLVQEVKGRVEPRILEDRLRPVRERDQKLALIRQLEVKLAASESTPVIASVTPGATAPPQIDLTEFQQWRDVIGARLCEEVPELTESEGRGRAYEAIKETRWRKAAESNRNDLMSELGQARRDSDVKSEFFPAADRWGLPGAPGFSYAVPPDG